MTQEVLKLALECAERCDHIDGMYSWSATITAIKEALSEHAMYEVQRLGQEIEQEPVAHQKWCASLTQLLLSMPPQPAPCNCQPPQRTWVGLDHHDKKKFSSWLDHKSDDEVFTAIEAKLKELNT
jgi:hypothetical protein